MTMRKYQKRDTSAPTSPRPCEYNNTVGFLSKRAKIENGLKTNHDALQEEGDQLSFDGVPKEFAQHAYIANRSFNFNF
jgi:hypothetical protein